MYFYILEIALIDTLINYNFKIIFVVKDDYAVAVSMDINSIDSSVWSTKVIWKDKSKC